MKEEIPALIQPPPTVQHASVKNDQGSPRGDAREPAGAEVSNVTPTPIDRQALSQAPEDVVKINVMASTEKAATSL